MVCEEVFTEATAVGLTTTVALLTAPGQPLAVAVMLKVTVCGSVPELEKLPLIFPDPEAGMAVLIPGGLSRVQEKPEPDVALLSRIVEIPALLQIF